MMDRSVAPPLEKITSISPISLSVSERLHGSPVYLIDEPSEDLTKIEIVFPAGTSEESKSLLAAATSAMLTEGAGDYSATQISETIDYFGAKIQANIGRDKSSISLLALKNRIEHVMPIFQAVVQSPSFLQPEFDMYRTRAKASLKTNLDRVEIQARLLFSKLFFSGSKYLESYTPEDFDLLDLADLRSFHQSNYRLADAVIFISGAETEKAFKLLDSHLKQDNSSFISQESSAVYPKKSIDSVSKKDALQSAIRMGFLAPTKLHQDYTAFALLNTLFGGYFGSRLMQNIREDKGYTYGVSSSLNHLSDLSYATITTQVGVEHTASTLKEIEKEVHTLRQTEVSSDELELVKNYTAGSLLRGFDGVFSKASLVKMMVLQGLEENYYSNFLERMYTITPKDILEIANKYLDFESMTGAVVGKSLTNNETSNHTSE